MGKQNYFFSGITDILILAILCEHDSYVYEIVKFIKEKSNGCLSISQNTVYAVTYKLVNEGKISEYSKLVGKKRTRIYYHIEDEGRAYYENLLESFHNAYSGVESILNILKEEGLQTKVKRGQGQLTITGIPYVVKKIRTGKYIKRLIAVVLILALISTVTYCIVLHEDHQITKRQEAVIAEDAIE